MRRRDFITLLGGAAAWPRAARGQLSNVPRVGILLIAGPDLMGPFREALADLGYVEGKNLVVEFRWSPMVEQMREAAAELAA